MTDFEIKKDTYILKSLIDQETGERLSLEEALSFTEDTTLYIDNLNILYAYLLKYLLSNLKLTCALNNLRLKKNTFSYSAKDGSCSNVAVMLECKIMFISFGAKFGIDFRKEYAENLELLEYAHERGRTASSVGSDAYNEFLSTLFRPKEKATANRQAMRDSYPIIKLTDELLQAKELCAGYQYVQQGRYSKAYNYDQASAYPAQLIGSTPTGKPYIFKKLNQIPKSYFYLVTFYYFDLKVKENFLNFLDLYKTAGKLTLTEHLYKQFKKHYEANIDIEKYTAFKTRARRFDKFINANALDGKENEPRRHIAKYNKFIVNSLIGYSGRNTQITYTTARLVNNKLIQSKKIAKIDTIYLPLYLYAVGKAKAEFVDTLQQHYDKLIYANTDGFITCEPLDLKQLNREYTGQLGRYKADAEYTQLYIESINGYAGIKTDGSIDNTISGMTIDSIITPQAYEERSFSYTVNEITAAGTVKIKRVKLNS